MLLHSAIYSTLNGFLGFGGGKKTKKRCGGEVRRRGDGGELEPGLGMAGDAVRMTAGWLEAVPTGCRWWWLVHRQSKYVITPLSRRGAAAVWTIFAPLEDCTGGGGGSGAGDGCSW